MKTATPKAEFSAFCSTVILTSPIFFEIKQQIIALNLWDFNFIEIENEMKKCSLEQ